MNISIIIPVLNELKTLECLLPYLLKHTQDHGAEIIVVDGNSRDGSAELAKKWATKTLVSTVSSRAAQMNLGARNASCDILYFVHADVIPPPDFLNDIVSAVKDGYSLGLYRQKFASPNPLLWINTYFSRFEKLWCRGGDQTLFILKKKFEQYGGYDESFIIMEEYDLLQKVWNREKIKFFNGYTTVSARKYKTNSWLRVQWANYTAFRLFRKGTDPKIIKAKYLSLLKPYENY